MAYKDKKSDKVPIDYVELELIKREDERYIKDTITRVVVFGLIIVGLVGAVYTRWPKAEAWELQKKVNELNGQLETLQNNYDALKEKEESWKAKSEEDFQRGYEYGLRDSSGSATDGTTEYEKGYDDGYDDGNTDGYNEAQAEFMGADAYTEGYQVGRDQGYWEGYDKGADKDVEWWYQTGESIGYYIGYENGKLDGRIEVKDEFGIGLDGNDPDRLEKEAKERARELEENEE